MIIENDNLILDVCCLQLKEDDYDEFDFSKEWKHGKQTISLSIKKNNEQIELIINLLRP